jgi:polygalacturonase
MSGGVRNMHVSNCTFIGTDVGLRFKSNRGRGGVVENIYINSIEMISIPSQAISFNLFYSGKSVAEDMEEGSSGQAPKLLAVTEETPQFRNIFIRNVNCKGSFQGIFLQGLPELNLENVLLENISMEAEWGLICSDASGIMLKNISLKTKKMPVVDIRNCKSVTLDRLTTSSGESTIIRLTGSRTENVILKNSGITRDGKRVVVGKEVPAGAVKVE